MQQMHLLASCFLNLRQGVDEVDLSYAVHGIDQEEHDRDAIFQESITDFLAITNVEAKWLGGVFLDGFCLGIGADKSVEFLQ